MRLKIRNRGRVALRAPHRPRGHAFGCRPKSHKKKFLRGQAGSRERGYKCGRPGNGNDRDVMSQAQCYEDGCPGSETTGVPASLTRATARLLQLDYESVGARQFM